MTDLVRTPPVLNGVSRRWINAALLAAIAHAAVFASLLPRRNVVLADSGSPVVLMDLAPVAVSPTSTTVDLAPGDIQPRLASEERTKTDPGPRPEMPIPEKVPPPSPASEAAIPLPVAPPKEQPKEKPVVAPVREASTAQPEATAPPPPPQSAPQAAPQAAAPAPGKTEGPSAQAIATWQRKLVVHLQKFQRYPRNGNGAKGISTLAFAIDRSGRVTEIHVIQSSGSDAIDAAAVADIKRAEPLPSPPGNIADSLLTFSIPMEYRSYVRTAR